MNEALVNGLLYRGYVRHLRKTRKKFPLQCEVLNVTFKSLKQGPATYATRAHLARKAIFQWHAEALGLTFRFRYDSHRRYTDLDLYKNTYAVGTLYKNTYAVGTLHDLKSLSQ